MWDRLGLNSGLWLFAIVGNNDGRFCIGQWVIISV